MIKINRHYDIFFIGLVALGFLEFFVLVDWISFGYAPRSLYSFILIPITIAIFLIRQWFIRQSALNNYLSRCLCVSQTIVNLIQKCKDAEEFNSLERRFNRITELFVLAVQTRKIPEKEPEDF